MIRRRRRPQCPATHPSARWGITIRCTRRAGHRRHHQAVGSRWI